MPWHYPFSAVVGDDRPDGDGRDGDGPAVRDDPADLTGLRLALVLTAISPAIGGVLVRGEKGTAKSTAVRGLAAVLPPIDVVAGDRFSSDPADPSSTSPDGPFGADAPVRSRPVRLVELPVGATDDRVVGSLHLERALRDAAVEFEPGLLARAHRGILYVDEVNLLPDHLVDLLLDAAAMGRVTVERDGVSLEHAASFVLIGTMNPEEGELRPQFLDRFGLTVEVAAPRDAPTRAEVVRRRLAFDADPASFVAAYRDADDRLTARVDAARRRLPSVRLGDDALTTIAEVCAAFDVDGLRADIVTARAALAHAAWMGRGEVTTADIRLAATMALPHRRRRKPFDAPGLDEDLLDQVLDDHATDDDPPPRPPGPPTGGGPSPDREQAQSPAGDAAQSAAGGGSDVIDPADHEAETSRVGAETPYRARLLAVPGVGGGTSGHRSRAITSSGRRVAATPRSTDGGAVHLLETIRAAAGRQGARGPRGGRLRLRPEDLRVAVREGREVNLVLFCVDASGSMAARRRMTQVKTAVLSLLLDAYRRRDKVGLVTFSGHRARLVLPPTHSVDVAAALLEEIPAGGRTPLAEGLAEAAAVLRRERLRDPRLRPLLVVVTDGRATHGAEAVARSLLAADDLAALRVASVVVDSESGPMRLGLATGLALRLGAEQVAVHDVSAEALTSVVQGRIA